MSSIIEKISKDKPTGKDYKYEDSYLLIEAEIDKTMSASNAGEVDWKLIQQSCEAILKNESKDLKIASYWLYAQWRLLSLDGLISSLPIYIELLKTYKLKLFPKSKKVKLRILEWLEESLAVAIMPIINEVDKEQLKVLVLNLELLEVTIVEVFEEELTLFSSLLRKIKKKSQEKEALQEEVVSKEVSKEENKINTSKENNEKEPVERVSISYSSNRHKEVIKEALGNLSLSDKNEYLLFELGLTLGIHTLTISFKENNPIERDKFPTENELKSLDEVEDEKETLVKVKSLLSLYPCWIRGYYLILKNINIKDNAKHNKIYLNTLKFNLINFLSNNGENLHNFTPLDYNIIDDEIKKWVKLEKNFSTFKNNSSVFEEKYQEALKLVEEKKNREAIVLIDNMKINSKSSEESFLWTLKEVELAIKIDNRNMAIALLQTLDSEIEAFNIAIWKPDLAIKVYVLLLKPSLIKILSNLNKELIYRKLCRLSPKDANEVGFL